MLFTTNGSKQWIAYVNTLATLCNYKLENPDNVVNFTISCEQANGIQTITINGSQTVSNNSNCVIDSFIFALTVKSSDQSKDTTEQYPKRKIKFSSGGTYNVTTSSFTWSKTLDSIFPDLTVANGNIATLSVIEQGDFMTYGRGTTWKNVNQ